MDGAVEGHLGESGAPTESRPVKPGITGQGRPGEHGCAGKGRLDERSKASKGRPAEPGGPVNVAHAEHLSHLLNALFEVARAYGVTVDVQVVPAEAEGKASTFPPVPET
ncbi:hypothetical protein [Nonomuraea sp. NPDC023979]|uniref:hypothetical protein n=1 Tax=Nonomuraea sp. NPDC023979 TaxID=3154796 RepID=UPI00340B131A